MQKLDSKRIDSALKSLENAAKGAVRSLNEMTENSFKGSTLESDPLNHLAQIVRHLQKAADQVTLDAKYEGMDTDQIIEAQAKERADELEAIQNKFNEKLANRHKQPEPEESEEVETEQEVPQS